MFPILITLCYFQHQNVSFVARQSSTPRVPIARFNRAIRIFSQRTNAYLSFGLFRYPTSILQWTHRKTIEALTAAIAEAQAQASSEAVAGSPEQKYVSLSPLLWCLSL